MIVELEALELPKKPGKNVLTFSRKVVNKARQIERSDQQPHNLASLVAGTHCSSTVTKFAIHADQNTMILIKIPIPISG